MLSNLKIGDVVKTHDDSRPRRVLFCDHIEVFYDSAWGAPERWTFGSSRRRCIYYRMSLSRFVDGAEFIRHEALTPEERDVHQPHLPMRLLRFESACWSPPSAGSLEQFRGEISRLSPSMSAPASVELDCHEIALSPHPGTSRVPPPTIVDPHSISTIDLLCIAYEAQRPFQRVSSEGIGLYRSGLAARGVPSYYIGQYHDAAGITRNISRRPPP